MSGRPEVIKASGAAFTEAEALFTNLRQIYDDDVAFKKQQKQKN